MKNEYFGHLSPLEFEKIKSTIYVHVYEDGMNCMCCLEREGEEGALMWNGGSTLDESRRSFKDTFKGSHCKIVVCVSEFESIDD